MDSDLTLDFIIIVVLIIANGLFSMTELAIVNAKKRKLEEMAEAVSYTHLKEPNRLEWSPVTTNKLSGNASFIALTKLKIALSL